MFVRSTVSGRRSSWEESARKASWPASVRSTRSIMALKVEISSFISPAGPFAGRRRLKSAVRSMSRASCETWRTGFRARPEST